MSIEYELCLNILTTRYSYSPRVRKQFRTSATFSHVERSDHAPLLLALTVKVGDTLPNIRSATCSRSPATASGSTKPSTTKAPSSSPPTAPPSINHNLAVHGWDVRDMFEKPADTLATSGFNPLIP